MSGNIVVIGKLNHKSDKFNSEFSDNYGIQWQYMYKTKLHWKLLQQTLMDYTIIDMVQQKKQ